MTATDSGYATPHTRQTSSMSIEAVPDLYDAMEKVERAAKRLSLPDTCPTCGQDASGPGKSHPRRSYSVKEFVDIPLDNLSGSSRAPKTPETPIEAVDEKTSHGLRFWLIIVALVVVAGVTALEGTIVGTSLPTIVDDLGGGRLYIWTINVYFLTSMAFQPLCGQMANIFGRKPLLIIATLIFLAGSGICGGAQNMVMLIAGRAVQGAGAGGMNVLAHVIISDIIPLRERGKFMAIIYLAISVGTGIGPLAGGLIVENGSWRWVFLLNLPVGGLALILVALFLRVSHKDTTLSITAKLKRVDFIGSAIFIPSIASILLGLTWGGTVHTWTSFEVLLPLLLGFVGTGAYLAFEWSRFCVEPTTPRRLFTNRTTVAALLLALLTSLLMWWTMYWLPVYFQSVLSSSPVRSGVQILPFIFVMVPFGAIAGRLLAKFGRYRLMHLLGFALITIGFGLMSTLGSQSPTSAWTCFEILVAAGCGFLLTTTLPAVQAPLKESDTAVATGTWAFTRSFGTVLAVPIPAAVFNNQINNLSGRIDNPLVRQLLMDGQAYEHATASFIDLFQDILRGEVISVFSDSLKLVWQVGIGIAGLGFIIVFMEEEIFMRTALKTDYGVEAKKKQSKTSGVAEA